jgi:tubulin polyglutamylase TTLL6/13
MQGIGIQLFRGLENIPTTCGDTFVVQRYAHNPLLVDGLKFDLRVYVIVLGNKPL